MHRILALIITLLVLGPFPPVLAAQEAGSAGEPAVGDTVPFLGPEGSEEARFTVTDLTDPLTDYDAGSPPVAGHHFVLLALAIEATGARPFSLDPNRILLQDSDGYLSSPTSISRGDVATPELPAGEIAPGDQVSGVLGFATLNDVSLARVLYQPQRERLLVLAELGASAPALGESLSLRGPDGADLVRLTATELADPFEGYDASSPPVRGSHYVLLTVAAENTSPRPFTLDPGAVLVQDADGFVATAQSIYRGEDASPVDLQYGEIAVGEQSEGVIGFSVLNGAPLARILYAPSSDRLVVLADLTAATPAASQATASADAATPPPTEATPALDAGTPTAAIGDSTDECAGADVWLDGTLDHIRKAATMSREDANPDDLTVLEEHAGDYADLAEAQAAMEVPAAAVEANDAAVAVFTSYAEAVTQVVEANGDVDALVEGVNAFNDAGTAVNDLLEQLQRIADDCDISV